MARLSGRQAAEPSQRQLRVGELVRHALADVLTRREIDDPLFDTVIISIAEVRVSPDMKHATVFTAPMIGSGKKKKSRKGKKASAGSDISGADASQAIVEGLNRHAKFLRGRISPALRQMKSLPDLKFQLDTRFDDDARIDALLRSPDVARDITAGDAAPQEGERS